MFSRRLKVTYFVIEGLHSFETVFYFYYFYFFMQHQFGFGNKANLILAALNGGTYAVFAFLGGKLAQRFGYLQALMLGFGIMLAALATGSQVSSAEAHIAVMLVAVIGMCLTWPTLEALVSEGESRGGVQHMVGVYNVVWAATAALANFSGGAMLVYLGLKSLFYVPAAILLINLLITAFCYWQVRRGREREPGTEAQGGGTGSATDTAIRIPLEPHPVGAPKAKSFLRMAWLANPFAYIAINTVVAVMPGLTLKLDLATTVAGFCASVWTFSRLGAFTLFWLWDGWHYRFRWLLVAYLCLAGSFTAVLLASNVAVLVLGQLVLGLAVGLLYYSSLFYSMDSSETKGEHGGIHEAVIGIGNFAGPAVGAAALQFLPQYANSGAYSVALLLLMGLGGLAFLWRKGA